MFKGSIVALITPFKNNKLDEANGFMNGKGTFTWADGKQKTGIWKNGALQE